MSCAVWALSRLSCPHLSGANSVSQVVPTTNARCFQVGSTEEHPSLPDSPPTSLAEQGCRGHQGRLESAQQSEGEVRPLLSDPAGPLTCFQMLEPDKEVAYRLKEIVCLLSTDGNFQKHGMRINEIKGRSSCQLQNAGATGKCWAPGFLLETAGNPAPPSAPLHLWLIGQR